MPVPAPVPLEPVLTARSGGRTRWVWVGALTALAAMGCALWWLDGLLDVYKRQDYLRAHGFEL